MDVPRHTIAYRARYVFPIDSPPIKNGVVCCEEGRIRSVSEGASAGPPPVDLGNVALVPGFVNAHTHLEFSHLDAPLGEAAMPFGRWIERVVELRRSRQSQPDAGFCELVSSLASGFRESLRHGVVSLGEIATHDWNHQTFPDSVLDITLFREVIDLARDSASQRLQEMQAFLDGANGQSLRFLPGVSPHAPYTVSPALVESLCDLSSKRRVPIAMHVAESMEELELLGSGSGGLVETLTELGAWDPTSIPRGSRPLMYLEFLAKASRALVIHGNFLDVEELQFLADRRDRMTVVFCPRTHDFFDYGSYPLREMLSIGVSVALGTDSRASNPDLSLLNELRHVARTHPAVRPADILRLGTINGAKALGGDRQIGTITPGKRAHLAAISLPAHDANDPHELLLDSDESVASVFFDGELFDARTVIP